MVVPDIRAWTALDRDPRETPAQITGRRQRQPPNPAMTLTIGGLIENPDDSDAS
jgi:hypothetical protein